MSDYFRKRDRFNNDREKYYQQKANLRLKYAALCSITIAIILLGATAFFIDSITFKTLLVLRGCAGVFALIFVVLVAILIYRVNASYFADRYNPKH